MKVPEPHKLPSGNWFINLRLGGKNIPVTRATKKECEDAAALIKAEHRAGKREEAPADGSSTLGQVLDIYIAARSNILSPSTIKGYETIRNNRFQGFMGKKIADIKDWQVICNLEAKKMSAKSLKNAWYLVASALKDAGADVPSVKLPQVVVEEHPYLMPEQIQPFIRAVAGADCEIPSLLGLSSLRRSEICALDWANVDLAKQRLLVSGAAVYDKDNNLVQKKTNKNSSSRRYVPIMIPELLTALTAVTDKSGLVVTCNPNTIWAQVNRTCRINGFPLIGVHGLRHSFASLAYHLGMPEKIAMQIGGWADFETMRKIYTHISQKDTDKYAGEMKQFYEIANENANENKKACVIKAYTV